jgi:hypothetical protein
MELAQQKIIRILQSQCRLVADMAAKVAGLEAAAADATVGVGKQSGRRDEPAPNPSPKSPTVKRSSTLAEDWKSLSAEAVVIKERDCAQAEARRMKFRLDDQEVVWKVRRVWRPHRKM